MPEKAEQRAVAAELCSGWNCLCLTLTCSNRLRGVVLLHPGCIQNYGPVFRHAGFSSHSFPVRGEQPDLLDSGTGTDTPVSGGLWLLWVVSTGFSSRDLPAAPQQGEAQETSGAPGPGGIGSDGEPEVCLWGSPEWVL